MTHYARNETSDPAPEPCRVADRRRMESRRRGDIPSTTARCQTRGQSSQAGNEPTESDRTDCPHVNPNGDQPDRDASTRASWRHRSQVQRAVQTHRAARPGVFGQASRSRRKEGPYARLHGESVPARAADVVALTGP